MTRLSRGRRWWWRGVMLLAVAAVLAVGAFLLWRWPFGWRGVERAGWLAGIASGLLSAVSTVAAILALRPGRTRPAPDTAEAVDVPPAVRSEYARQIRALAPPALLDRDDELVELARFCASGPAALRWWQASPWAGKTALLAWFALHPPAGIRLVAFFITARLAGQADRVAFTDVVMEQLAELLGRPMPAYLTDATRDAHFHGLLADAADLCRQRGERLVLLVDGLDEDRGLTVDADQHSIAALLPAEPSAGLRVIVAGREGRGVPDDVPADHPLRDPAVVRRLRPSPHARVLQREAERDLRRLLHGPEIGQTVLGLLVAAGGGLTVEDLAELTRRPRWQVEAHLSAMPGRAFTRRPGHWRGPDDVYLLGHEQLSREAVAFLGAARLAAHRERLHEWADGYRERQWPATTPHYLLREYFAMLQNGSDWRRMLELALDSGRQQRMVEVSGAPAAAVAEIAAIQNGLADDPEPARLTDLARLGVRRAMVLERGRPVPRRLPALWARLGDADRAEALARSFAAPDRRASALAGVAVVLAGAGDTARARSLAVEAGLIARSFPQPEEQVWATAAVVDAAAAAGLVDDAEELAHLMPEPRWRAVALARVARVRSGTDPDRARRLVDEARLAADSISDPEFHAWALAAVARAAVAAGDPASALAIAEHAVAIDLTHTDPLVEPWELAHVAEAVAEAGDLARAVDIAGMVVLRGSRVRALSAVATMAADGDPAWAIGLAAEAEAAARSIDEPAEQAVALAAVVPALIAAGADSGAHAARLAGQAAALAEDAPGWEASALIAAGEALAAAGDPARAAALAERAATVVPASVAEYGRAGTLTALVEPLAVAGDPDGAAHLGGLAEAAARSVTDPNWRAQALLGVAAAFATIGDVAAATRIVRSLPDPGWRNAALTAVIMAAPATADPVPAETAASEADDPVAQSRLLAVVAVARAAGGDPDGAAELLDRAESLADSAKEIDEWAPIAVAVAMVQVGELDQAVRIATSMRPADDWTFGLLTVAEAAARTTRISATVAGSAIEDLAEASDDAWCRASMLAAIAAADAEPWDARAADRIARALSRAQALADPDERASVLARLAIVRNCPEPDRLLRQAVMIGHWETWIGGLAVVAPAAVRAVADDVVRTSRPSDESELLEAVQRQLLDRGE